MRVGVSQAKMDFTLTISRHRGGISPAYGDAFPLDECPLDIDFISPDSPERILFECRFASRRDATSKLGLKLSSSSQAHL